MRISGNGIMKNISDYLRCHQDVGRSSVSYWNEDIQFIKVVLEAFPVAFDIYLLELFNAGLFSTRSALS